MQWAIVLALLAAPLRCGPLVWMPTEPDRAPLPTESGSDPKPEITPERVVPPVAKGPPPTKTLPEDVITRTLDSFKPSFVACFERARRQDPLMGTTKVTLHMELDVEGVVTTATTDSDRPKLSNCLIAVGRGVKFPAPHQPAYVDLPLLF